MKKALLFLLIAVLCIPTVYAEENVVVTLPSFDITLNGMVVDNINEPYPFIVYKGITYLPMTWDMSYALGLELKWSEITGLQVNQREMVKPYVRQSQGINTATNFSAKVVEFPVNVNGKKVDNKTAEYPLLNFRNVTYFPMTYDYMVNEFHAGYKWDDSTGLKISADNNLNIFYPEPFTKKFTIDFDNFSDDDLYVDDMVKITRVSSRDLRVTITGGTHPEYDGYIIDTQVNYYDMSGNFISTDTRPSHKGVYNGIKTSQFPVHSKYFEDPLYNATAEVEVTFEPKEISLSRSKEQFPDVEWAYIASNRMDIDRIRDMGAVYIEAVGNSVESNLPTELIPYDMMRMSSGALIDETSTRYKILNSNGKAVASEKSTDYVALSTITKMYVDPTVTDNNSLILEKDGSVVYTFPYSALRLYDKDKNLFKIIINDAIK